MKKEKKREFSKTLLIQESALVWVVTLFCLALSAYCISKGFTGSLPWISSIIVSIYTAYGVSQAMYYRKAQAENTEGGVKYQSVVKEIEEIKEYYNNNLTIDYSTDGIDYTAGTISYESESSSDEECGI